MARTTCPQCRGRKQVTVTVTEHGKSGETTTSFPMDCPTCEGAGRVTARQAREHAAMVASWCRCDMTKEVLDRLVFHPDSPTSKHHWDCGVCGGLVQVG